METGTLVNLVDYLVKSGDMYIDSRFDRSTRGSSKVEIFGKLYYRFMDFFYLPRLPCELSFDQMSELCDLRLDYLDKVVNQDINVSIIRCMTDYIQKNLELSNCPRILDFGCGSGLSSRLISQEFQSVDLRGIDTSRKAIEIAIECGLVAELVAVKSSFPFEDSFFDAVFAVFVMHFNVDFHSLSEIYRVLVEGGNFIFNFYDCTIEPLRDLLLKAGFSTVDLVPSSCMFGKHFVAICTK